MPRYALLIEYDGTPFRGWQTQVGLPSVQGAVEAAIAKLERDVPRIGAAGRTDTGVHATGQVAHCDLTRDWDPFRLSEALNYHLKPAPVAILKAAKVDERWHARFTALERRYTYRIIARRAPLVLDAARAWHVKVPLDCALMQAAADMLTGTHDFTTFRATMCQAKSPMKTLDSFKVEEISRGDGQEIRLHLSARSFLHNQVRSLAGTLEKVGSGAWTPEDMKAALDAKDRARCGPVAPAHGLTLRGVEYPEPVF